MKNNLKLCQPCNEGVYEQMKYYVKKKGMSVRAASRQVEHDSGGGVTAGRARQTYINRQPSGTNVPPTSPPAKPSQPILWKRIAKSLEKTIGLIESGAEKRPIDATDDTIQLLKDSWTILEMHLTSIMKEVNDDTESK